MKTALRLIVALVVALLACGPAMGLDDNPFVRPPVNDKLDPFPDTPTTSTTLPLPSPIVSAPGLPDVMERTNSSVTLRWYNDDDDRDTQNVLYRSRDGGAWEAIASFGPLAGFVDFTDTGAEPWSVALPGARAGLAADTQYRYRVAASDGERTVSSETRWVYTKAEAAHPVWRIQLTIGTGTPILETDEVGRGTVTDDAATRDDVVVRLNSRAPQITPHGNETWLDYGGPDFARGTLRTFDLNLTSVRDLADITMLSITKPGRDDWCVTYLNLKVNGIEVYSEGYLDRLPGCLHLSADRAGEDGNYTVDFARLRAHELWQRYRTPLDVSAILTKLVAGQSVDVFDLSNDELEDRIEGMVGHALHGTKAKWGSPDDEKYVEVEQKGLNELHFDLDLEGDVPVLPDPSLDVDADLEVEGGCDLKGNAEFRMFLGNLQFDAGFDFVTRFVLGRMVKEIVSFMTGGALAPDGSFLGDWLEAYVESRAREAFGPISEEITLDDLPLCKLGVTPQITVTRSGGIIFTLVPTPECKNARLELGEVCDDDEPCPNGSPAGAFVRCLDECRTRDTSACTPSPVSVPAPGSSPTPQISPAPDAPADAPSCGAGIDCDDGDPCTADACEGGRCTATADGSLGEAECRLLDAITRPLCGAEELPARLRRATATRLRKALAALRAAATAPTPSHARRALARAVRHLKGLERAAAHAVGRRKLPISGECYLGIDSFVTVVMRGIESAPK